MKIKITRVTMIRMLGGSFYSAWICRGSECRKYRIVTAASRRRLQHAVDNAGGILRRDPDCVTWERLS
jgi:hypothetical protein